MIVWKKNNHCYAGTIRFLLGVVSPSLSYYNDTLKVGDYVNGCRINAIIEI